MTEDTRLRPDFQALQIESWVYGSAHDVRKTYITKRSNKLEQIQLQHQQYKALIEQMDTLHSENPINRGSL